MIKPRIGGDRHEVMLLSLVAWLCSLPLLALLVQPFLGWRTTAAVGLSWLILLLVECFVICLWRLPRRPHDGNAA